jgi:hypothetical protein
MNTRNTTERNMSVTDLHSSIAASASHAPGEASYWLRYLDGFTPEPFPRLTGLKSSSLKSQSEIATLTSTLPSSSLTLAALQAAWAFILSSYSDTMSSDIVFGTVLNDGRGIVPTRVNTGPGAATVSSVLQSLEAANSVVEENLPVQLEGATVYDTTLSFNFTVEPGADVVVAISAVASSNGKLRLAATFKSTHLMLNSAVVMLRQLESVLSHLISHPEAVYTDVNGVVASELLCASNPHPRGVQEPAGGSALRLHAQFEDFARETPEKVALVFKQSLGEDP